MLATSQIWLATFWIFGNFLTTFWYFREQLFRFLLAQSGQAYLLVYAMSYVVLHLGILPLALQWGGGGGDKVSAAALNLRDGDILYTVVEFVTYFINVAKIAHMALSWNI